MSREERSEELTSKAAGAVLISMGASDLLGPVLGRALYEWVGYEWTLTAISGLITLLGTGFFIWGGVF